MKKLVFFSFEVANCVLFKGSLCSHLNRSSVAPPNAHSSRVLFAACANKSERTSDLPRGRKEDLKTSSAFESVCLSYLNAQSWCFYKLNALELCLPKESQLVPSIHTAFNCLPDWLESTWTQWPDIDDIFGINDTLFTLLKPRAIFALHANDD